MIFQASCFETRIERLDNNSKDPINIKHFMHSQAMSHISISSLLNICYHILTFEQ